MSVAAISTVVNAMAMQRSSIRRLTAMFARICKNTKAIKTDEVIAQS